MINKHKLILMSFVVCLITSFQASAMNLNKEQVMSMISSQIKQFPKINIGNGSYVNNSYIDGTNIVIKIHSEKKPINNRVKSSEADSAKNIIDKHILPMMCSNPVVNTVIKNRWIQSYSVVINDQFVFSRERINPCQ